MSYFDKAPIEAVVLDYISTDDSDSLEHYGMPRRSGRYPWGSGGNPYQRTSAFRVRVDELKAQGMSERDIAETLGILKDGKPSSTRLRIQYAVERENERAYAAASAKRLREKEGMSLKKIAEVMGYKNDSSVVSLLNEDVATRKNAAKQTAEFLKKQVDEKGMIDVGSGVEYSLNISRTKLDEAIYRLELEGYKLYGGSVPQATNKTQMTHMKVLCKPGTEHKDIYDYDKIKTIDSYISRDGGDTFTKAFQYPASMDSKRLKIRYAEEGGIERDGTIMLRPGVDDLSLSGRHYSQVRILVDKDRYLKGMAYYGDPKDFPDGVDVIFNTNKKQGTPMRDVLKKIKDDPENPFGALIKEHGGQYTYIDKDGKEKLGLINKKSDEGDWTEWKDKIASQMLSKQPAELIDRQLTLSITKKQTEYEKISSLTNPTIKRKLLEDFANDCDSDSVSLKAAALPGQKYSVIMPVNSLSEKECYAPRYANGTKLALIRYPHGGTFEIPIVTVNNKNKEGKNMLGTDSGDAIGINHKVAERLSGADFDGDTVMMIPLGGKNNINIKSTPQLEGLKDFDPKTSYGTTVKIENGKEQYYSASGRKVKIMSDTQNQMGRISNLISDMTLQGADDDDLAAAVRHSMVVIDAEKHKLDYQKSYIDNNIEALKKKYQEGGASTLISRAKSQKDVVKRQGSPRINTKLKRNGEPNPDYDPSRPEGALIYKTADNPYRPDWKKNSKTGLIDIKTTEGKKISYNPLDPKAQALYTPAKTPVLDEKTGQMVYYNKDKTIAYKSVTITEKVSKMSDTDDAYTLISRANTGTERLYADYANKLKNMANEARKQTVMTQSIKTNKEAKEKYKDEIQSLNDKIVKASLNKPRERQAQLATNSEVRAKKLANPDMTNEEIKKASQQALTKYRAMYGAKREEIEITPKEWEAIQSGAITETTLNKIINRADMDKLRDLATPREKTTIPQAKISRMQAMQKRGYTIAEIAEALGYSSSTIQKYIK